MHILNLTHLFHPALGGTERALFDLSREMVKRGHRVTVLTSDQLGLEDFQHPRFHPSLPEEETWEGIRIIRVRLSPFQRTLLAKLGALCLRSRYPSGDTLWYRTQVPHLPQMIRRARKLNPDLIYAVPFPTATHYYAWRTARQLGCPWVIQPHIHEAQMNKSLLKILKWLFPKASAVLTNTEPEKKFLISQGLEASKIRVFGQGLPETALIPGDGRAFRRRQGWADEPLIVFLGRKVEGKGIETLLAALPQVWAEEPRAMLLLAGQRSPYFKDLLARLPVGSDARIRSLDNFPEEEKIDLLAAADLLALPSAVESFGVVFLEAWAQKKPVIGTDIPAVAAMIEDGQDGLLVPGGDSGALAGAILRLVKDPDLRLKLGKAGEVKVRERFAVGKVAERMEALFLELLHNQGK
jgi:glycosyltransferase involved in cell wall biosynthesis